MNPRTDVARRTVLAGAVGGLAAALAGCGSTDKATDPKPDAAAGREAYGSDPSQFGDLYLPEKQPSTTVVLIHGGFWYAEYGLDLMAPMAEALVDQQCAVWNLEYRRIGNGGGWPTTFEDVAAGIDHLKGLNGVTLDNVLVLGHSAGGHLAVWAACRRAGTPGGPSTVALKGAVSLAGALDLTLGATTDLGDGAVGKFLGGSPTEVPQRYRLGDPTQLVPPTCPVVAMRGVDDEIVPRNQSTSFVAAARKAGGKATFVEVEGDHFSIIKPEGRSWQITLDQLTALAKGQPIAG